ncbi:MAG TPA: protein kinase [Gemmataceae bacterium]
MRPSIPCPDLGSFRSLIEGDLSIAEKEALLWHLEACNACARKVQTMPEQDRLLSWVRQTQSSSRSPEDRRLASLIGRLIPSAAANSSATSALATKNIGPARLFSFACAGCGKPLRIPEELAGKKVQCPYCGRAVSAPATVREEEPAGTMPSEGAETAVLPPTWENEAGDAGPVPPAATPQQRRTEYGQFCAFLAPPQAADELGRLGPYRVLKVLGVGGMGVVFRAEDPQLQRPVALKAMLPALAANEAARQRFLREARAAASIKHEHIVTIHQVSEDRGAPFLAMEYLEGESLADRVKRAAKLPLPEVLRIGREVAEGLEAAHEKGLIHRDIKPSNVWLEGKRGRVKVLDFGLARTNTGDSHLTQLGDVLGTPEYMPPEQARGDKVDARCDLYSLGCVLYRLCTGELPFKADNRLSLLMALANEQPRSPRALNPDVPPALADLILRLLAKEPAQRPATAGEVAAQLEAIAEEVRPQWERKRRPSVTPWPRLPRRWLGPVIAALLLLGIGGAYLIYQVVLIEPENAKKQEKKSKAVDPAEEKDAAWLKEVAALSPDKQVKAVAAKLKERNPDFDGDMMPTIEPGVVTGLRLATDNVKDISPLRALTGLRDLQCGIREGSNRRSPLADLAPLKNMKLTSLEINVTSVSDLTPLKDMKLTHLECLNTPVSDLLPLKGMKLEYLDCKGARVSDLLPLKDMKLTVLYCSYTDVSDLSPLKDMPLTHLGLESTPVSDLSPLKGMKLKVLYFSATKVSDLSPLKGMPLSYLYCDKTPVSDLSPLKGMPLTFLRCDFNPERDAALLRSIKSLREINEKPAEEFWKEVDAKKLP